MQLEIAKPNSDAGCGCAYPPWVDDPFVERSNNIARQLQLVGRLVAAMIGVNMCEQAGRQDTHLSLIV